MNRLTASWRRRSGAIWRLTLVNHATGPHGFELFDDSKASHDVVRAMIAFIRDGLEAERIAPYGIACQNV